MLGFVINMTVQTILSQMQNTFLILTKQGKDGSDIVVDDNDSDTRRLPMTAIRFAMLPFYRLFCSTIEHYWIYVKSVCNYSYVTFLVPYVETIDSSPLIWV